MLQMRDFETRVKGCQELKVYRKKDGTTANSQEVIVEKFSEKKEEALRRKANGIAERSYHVSEG